MIFVNALGVVGIYLLLRRLFGQSIALLAGLLLALDPFVAGLGGLLHVDGLLTTFATLSVLALFNGLCTTQFESKVQSPKSKIKWFALSGGFAALAFLSKSPALFLTPFAVLVTLVALLTKRISLHTALIGLLVFVIVHWSLVIVLYPAMWLDPIGTFNGIVGLASFYSANAVRPTLFDGQYVLNHGPAFYPTALAYRLTPIVMIGLILTVVALIAQRKNRDHRFPLAACLAYAILFIVFITPVAKKYDRYMLPAVSMLIIAAAWGLGQIHAPKRFLASLGMTKTVWAITLIAQLLIVLGSWPYLLMSYNVVLGGAAAAAKHFAVGWGEGLGAAANWINAQPDGLRSTVAVGSIPPFGLIYSGRSTSLDDRGLELADYYVITLSERQLDPKYFALLQARGQIVYAPRTGDVEGAWVFNNDHAQQQADFLRQANPQTDAIVTLSDLPVSRAYHGQAQLVVLPREITPQAIEQTLNDLSTRYRRLWFTWSDTVSPIVQAQLKHWLDQTSTLAGQTEVGGLQIAAYDLQPGQLGRLDPFVMQFGGNFALVGITSRPSGEIALRWQSRALVSTPYSVTLKLVDSEGTEWSSGGNVIQDQDQFSSDTWPIGHVADQQLGFKIPPEAPPGDYGVRVSIDQADGQRVGLVNAAGTFSGIAPMLTSLHIAPPDQPLGSLNRDIPFPYSHTWANQIKLLGFDSGPGQVINGDLWTVNAIWRSLKDNLPDYSIVWQVRDQSGAQVYAQLFPLSAYSTDRWRTGEVIGARYTLRFPVELKSADYHVSIGVNGPDGKVIDGDLFTPFDVRLLHRDRSFELPSTPRTSLDVTFNDRAIQLIGADLLDEPLHAGDPLPVTLYWKAGRTTETLYTVFTHLETLDGQVIAQRDSAPQGGGMLTTWWSPGQIIPDAYPLTIPANTPPGAYRIVVGLYNPLDGVHLIDLATGEGRVVLNPPIVVR